MFQALMYNLAQTKSQQRCNRELLSSSRSYSLLQDRWICCRLVFLFIPLKLLSITNLFHKVPQQNLCVRLSPQIPRQLYTTRSEKLVSEMVDFHHCIPHNEVRGLRVSCDLVLSKSRKYQLVFFLATDSCTSIVLQLYDACKGKTICARRPFILLNRINF